MTELRNYWDMSEKERAALTRDQVDLMIKRAVMMAGLVYPVAPQTQSSLIKDGIAKDVFYQVMCGNSVIATFTDEAEALGMSKSTSFRRTLTIYLDKSYRNNVSGIDSSPQTLTVSKVWLPWDTTIETFKSDHAAELNSMDNYVKAKDIYDKTMVKINKIVDDIWDNYNSIQDYRRSQRELLKTFEEYKSLAEGDAYQAEIFLRKSYGDKEVETAFENYQVPTLVVKNPDGGYERKQPQLAAETPAVVENDTMADAGSSVGISAVVDDNGTNP